MLHATSAARSSISMRAVEQVSWAARVDYSLFAHEGEKLGVCFSSAHLGKLEVSHTAKHSGKT